MTEHKRTVEHMSQLLKGAETALRITMTELGEAREEAKKLKKALKVYADPKSWSDTARLSAESGKDMWGEDKYESYDIPLYAVRYWILESEGPELAQKALEGGE
ncbi:MAG TPA: hypothetical protein PKD55_02580 [Bellilinea sp.]|nr:hypothetical protein [Bellilinea sp.]